jgi:hypothetical protein
MIEGKGGNAGSEDPSANSEQLNQPNDNLGEYPTWNLGQTEQVFKEAGWDNVTEFLLDVSGYFIQKPYDPSIPKEDIDALDEATLSSVGMTANRYEANVVQSLERNGFERLIPQFKQEMTAYCQGIRAVVANWRERGLL